MKEKYKLPIIIFITAFILNLIWEVSHFNLYICNLPGSYSSMILRATLIDALIILGIYYIIALINKNTKWIFTNKKLNYLITIILGTIIAVYIELNALNQDRWSYTQFMPTIFGIGLTPLLQMIILPLLTFMILKWKLKKI